jgi:hypothetical protein
MESDMFEVPRHFLFFVSGISCSLSLLLESTDIIRLEKQKKKEIK